MKTPPDNTIARIEALEKLTKEVQEAQQVDHANFDGRLTKLEGSDHEQRITALEKGLKALEDSLKAVPSADNSSIDTNQIMMQINLLKKDLEGKLDVDVYEKDQALVNLELKKIKPMQEDIALLNKDIQNVKHDIDRVQQELNYHKTNDFSKLADKVAELEKMIRSLKSQLAGLKHSDSNNTP